MPQSYFEKLARRPRDEEQSPEAVAAPTPQPDPKPLPELEPIPKGRSYFEDLARRDQRREQITESAPPERPGLLTRAAAAMPLPQDALRPSAPGSSAAPASGPTPTPVPKQLPPPDAPITREDLAEQRAYMSQRQIANWQSMTDEQVAAALKVRRTYRSPVAEARLSTPSISIGGRGGMMPLQQQADQQQAPTEPIDPAAPQGQQSEGLVGNYVGELGRSLEQVQQDRGRTYSDSPGRYLTLEEAQQVGPRPEVRPDPANVPQLLQSDEQKQAEAQQKEKFEQLERERITEHATLRGIPLRGPDPGPKPEPPARPRGVDRPSGFGLDDRMRHDLELKKWQDAKKAHDEGYSLAQLDEMVQEYDRSERVSEMGWGEYLLDPQARARAHVLDMPSRIVDFAASVARLSNAYAGERLERVSDVLGVGANEVRKMFTSPDMDPTFVAQVGQVVGSATEFLVAGQALRTSVAKQLQRGVQRPLTWRDSAASIGKLGSYGAASSFAEYQRELEQQHDLSPDAAFMTASVLAGSTVIDVLPVLRMFQRADRVKAGAGNWLRGTINNFIATGTEESIVNTAGEAFRHHLAKDILGYDPQRQAPDYLEMIALSYVMGAYTVGVTSAGQMTRRQNPNATRWAEMSVEEARREYQQMVGPGLESLDAQTRETVEPLLEKLAEGRELTPQEGERLQALAESGRVEQGRRDRLDRYMDADRQESETIDAQQAADGVITGELDTDPQAALGTEQPDATMGADAQRRTPDPQPRPTPGGRDGDTGAAGVVAQDAGRSGDAAGTPASGAQAAGAEQVGLSGATDAQRAEVDQAASELAQGGVDRTGAQPLPGSEAREQLSPKHRSVVERFEQSVRDATEDNTVRIEAIRPGDVPPGSAPLQAIVNYINRDMPRNQQIDLLLVTSNLGAEANLPGTMLPNRDGSMTLVIDANNPEIGLLGYTLHEIKHAIDQVMPEAAKRLAERLEREAPTFIDMVARDYAARARKRGARRVAQEVRHDPAKRRSEQAAVIAEDMAYAAERSGKQFRFLQDALAESNPSLWGKVKNAIRKALVRLRRAVTGTPYQTTIDQFLDEIADYAIQMEPRAVAYEQGRQSLRRESLAEANRRRRRMQEIEDFFNQVIDEAGEVEGVLDTDAPGTDQDQTPQPPTQETPDAPTTPPSAQPDQQQPAQQEGMREAQAASTATLSPTAQPAGPRTAPSAQATDRPGARPAAAPATAPQAAPAEAETETTGPLSYTNIPADWRGKTLYAWSNASSVSLPKGNRATGAKGKRKVRGMPPVFREQLGRVDKGAKRLIERLREITTDEVWKVEGSAGGFFLAPKPAIAKAMKDVPDWHKDVEAAKAKQRARKKADDAKEAKGYIVWNRLSIADRQMLQQQAEREGKTASEFIRDHNAEQDLRREDEQADQAERKAIEAVNEGELQYNPDDDAPFAVKRDILPPTLKIDGKDRPTTNSQGQPIHPTERGVRNFWKQFGDSKVVDDQGRPLVVYHGTGRPITRFDHSGEADEQFGVFYFTADQEYAAFRGVEKAKRDEIGRRNLPERGPGMWKRNSVPPVGANVVPAYLRMTKPARVTLGEGDFSRPELEQKYVRAAKLKGYDGIIFTSKDYNPSTGDPDVFYAVFDPTQIKSATGNTGEFNAADPDIRFAVRRSAANAMGRLFDAPGAENKGTGSGQRSLFGRPIEQRVTTEQLVETAEQAGLFGDVAAPAPMEDAPAAPPTQPAPGEIRDFGEKIGGARKDTAVSTGPALAKPKSTEPAWKRRFKVMQSLRTGKWHISDTKTGRDLYDSSTYRPYAFDTEAEADATVALAAVAIKHRVVSSRAGDTFRIIRQISDRKQATIKDGFASRHDAMTYMAKNAAEILETRTGFGEEILARPENARRIGTPRRTSDSTPQMFMSRFGFRGVEFGNWNNQIERQEVMNHAFDGLMDLADALNVPPKALSLNGELALAFGARGQGLSGAKAHYERDYGVINLTKMSGAGSLAHEWFHGFDHYLARQEGKAAAERVKNERGDLVYPATSTLHDYASHGFLIRGSKTRAELRQAYTDAIETLYRKAEQYREDTEQAERFVGKMRDELRRQLQSIRDGLARELDPKYYKRHNKPATDQQLSDFDALANRLIEGRDLEVEYRYNEKPTRRKLSTAGRWSNDTLDGLSDLYKAVRGRSGFNAQQSGAVDLIRSTVRNYAQRVKLLADAQAGAEKTRKTSTSYAMAAKEMDQLRSTDYWTTQHEMAARAFSAYVSDKIENAGQSSEFLVYGADNRFYKTMGVKPFPEGVERQAINKAFDRLFQTIKTQEVGGRSVLFAVAGAGLSASQQLNPRAVEAARTEWLNKGYDSRFFKRWWGRSKAVGADSKPKVLYHGTRLASVLDGDPFTEFWTEPNRTGGIVGPGTYLAENPEIGNSFGETGVVYPVLLSIQNPLDLDTWDSNLADVLFRALQQRAHQGYAESSALPLVQARMRIIQKRIAANEFNSLMAMLRTIGQNTGYHLMDVVQGELLKRGYDGLTHMADDQFGGVRNFDGGTGRVWVAYKPNQIKSVNNSGTFAVESPDIRFAVRRDPGIGRQLGLLGEQFDGAATGKQQSLFDTQQQGQSQLDREEQQRQARQTPEDGETGRLFAVRRDDDTMPGMAGEEGAGRAAQSPQPQARPGGLQKFPRLADDALRRRVAMAGPRKPWQKPRTEVMPREQWPSWVKIADELIGGRGWLSNAQPPFGGSVYVQAPGGAIIRVSDHMNIGYRGQDADVYVGPNADGDFAVRTRGGEQEIKVESPVLENTITAIDRVLQYVDPAARDRNPHFRPSSNQPRPDQGGGTFAVAGLLQTRPDVDGLGLYSPLRRTISELPGRDDIRYTSQQMLGMLKKRAGVKPEELEWSGIEDFVQGRDRVTKAELIEYLDQNGVMVEEVVKGERSSVADAAISEIRQLARQAGYEGPLPGDRIATIGRVGTHGGYAIYGGVIMEPVARQKDGVLIWRKTEEFGPTRTTQSDKFINELQDAAPHTVTWQRRGPAHNQTVSGLPTTVQEAIKARRKQLEIREIKPAAGAKYSDYQLPGGENYRELLLTLPIAPDTPAQQRYVVRSTQDGDIEGEFDSREAADAAASAQEGLVVDVQMSAEATRRSGPQGTYQSKHWDEPNVLAHVRMNDRTDAQGRRVLFIEEVQSDWHQAGRDRGYVRANQWTARKTGPAMQRGRPVAGYAFSWDVTADNGNVIKVNANTEAEAITAAQQIAQLSIGEAGVEQGGMVPDAPFKKTWHDLALKRMIAYASANGYDAIAWTPGDVQADRYDLSKQVDSVRWVAREGSDSGQLTAMKNGERVLVEQTTADKVADYIGKDPAQKLLEKQPEQDGPNQWREISGLDLKVGGSGMRAFYDTILVNSANKLGKKFGAKVERTQIGEGNDSIDSPALPITDTMRQTVLSEGLPRFAMAWHGSPHFFDRFTTAKMGTGEGAQAYGWGMYFAGKKEVAEHYRNTVGRAGRRDGTLDGKLLGEFLKQKNPYHERLAAAAALIENATPDAAQAALHNNRGQYRPEEQPVIDEAIKTVREWSESGRYKPGDTGHLYQVDLKPSEDEYLLFDRPLSEQSEKVKKALRQIGFGPVESEADMAAMGFKIGEHPIALTDKTDYEVRRSNGDPAPIAYGGGVRFRTRQQAVDRFASHVGSWDGSQIYDLVAQKNTKGTGYGAGSKFGQETASRDLRSLGIRGIKYLDGSSRGKGEGDYNYVIFDDADVEVTNRFAVAGKRGPLLPTGQEQAEKYSQHISRAAVMIAGTASGRGLRKGEALRRHINAWLAHVAPHLTDQADHVYARVRSVLVHATGPDGKIDPVRFEEAVARIVAPENAIVAPEAPAAMQDLIERLTGVKPSQGPVMTTTEAGALRARLRILAEAASSAASRQEVVAARVAHEIDQLGLRGPLTPNAAKQLARQAAKVNFGNPLATEQFLAHAERAVQNANYQADLARIEAIQRRAAQVAKWKTIPANHIAVLESMALLDARMITNLPELIERSARYMTTFLPKTHPRYSVGNTAQMLEYLEAKQAEAAQALRDMRIKALAAQAGVSEQDAAALLDAETEQDVEAWQAETAAERRAKLEAAMAALAEDSKAVLFQTWEPRRHNEVQRRIVDNLLKAPISRLTLDQMRNYVMTVDNIVVNDSFYGAARTEAIAKAAAGLGRAIEATKDTRKKRLARWLMLMGSTSDMFRQIYGYGPEMAQVQVGIGFTAMNTGYQLTSRQVKEIAQLTDNFFSELQKRHQYVHAPRGVVAEGLVAFLIQPVEGMTPWESLDNRRQILVQDIEQKRRFRRTQAEAKVAEELLRMLDAPTPEGVLEKFKRTMPGNHEVLMWYRDTLLPKYRDQLRDHDELFENQANNYNNPMYLPIRYRRLPLEKVEGEEGVKGISEYATRPKMAANAIKRRTYVNLPTGRMLDLNLRSNAWRSLSESLMKANTNPALEQIRDVLRMKDAEELFGGIENVSFVTRRLNLLHDGRSRAVGRMDELEATLDAISNVGRKYSTVAALGGADQAIKQAPDQLLTTLFNTNMRADLLGRSIVDYMSGEARDLLAKYAIGSRGDIAGGSKYVNSIEIANERAATAVRTGNLNKLRHAVNTIVHLRTLALRTSDGLAAGSGWLTYYRQSLKENGVKFTNWKREAELHDTDPKRQAAATYAESMVDITQASSDASKMSQLAQRGRHGGTNMLKAVFMPYSSFRIQGQSRILADLADLKSWRRPWRSGRSLAGTLAGYAAFNFVKGYMLYSLSLAVVNGVLQMFDYEPPEETDEERADREAFQFKRFYSQTLIDSFPIVGASPNFAQEKAVDWLNQTMYYIYKLQGADQIKDARGREYDKDAWLRRYRELPFYRYRSHGDDPLKMLGMFQIAAERPGMVADRVHDAVKTTQRDDLTEPQKTLMYIGAINEILYSTGMQDTYMYRIIENARRQADRLKPEPKD